MMMMKLFACVVCSVFWLGYQRNINLDQKGKRREFIPLRQLFQLQMRESNFAHFLKMIYGHGFK
jgi:hypothetical protein